MKRLNLRLNLNGFYFNPPANAPSSSLAPRTESPAGKAQFVISTHGFRAFIPISFSHCLKYLLAYTSGGQLS